MKQNLLLLALAGTMLFSCKKQDLPQPEIAITNFTPHAKGGESITISGIYFSPNASDDHVTINGMPATVTAATPTSLTVTVPSKAGSGPIVVNVGSKTFTSASNFIYDWVGVVTTFAGSKTETGLVNANGTNARFEGAFNLAFDANDNLYVTDQENYAIRKITPQGDVTTLAGGIQGSADGTGTNAQFDNPTGITVASNGMIYVTDLYIQRIRQITASGSVTTIAGSGNNTGGFADGDGAIAKFKSPFGITSDGNGNLYIADMDNLAIRKIVLPTTQPGQYTVSTLAKSLNQPLGFLEGITLNSNGDIYTTDGGASNSGPAIYKTSSGVASFFSGGNFGLHDGPAALAQFDEIPGIAIEKGNNVRKGYLYVADRGAGTVRMISPDGATTTIAGIADPAQIGFPVDGTGDQARFGSPSGIAIDSHGDIYIADFFCIRKIVLQ